MKFPTAVLKENSAREINETSIRLLEKVGLKIEHDKIRELLLKSGAQPGADSQIVKFPRAMLHEYLAQAPAEVKLPGRENGTERSVYSDSRTSVFWTAASMNLVRRNSREEFDTRSLAELSRLVEALPHLDGVVGVSVKDAEPRFRDFVGYRVMVENTGKHVRVLSFSPAGARAIIEMANVVLDGDSIRERPIFSMGFTAHGPLRWTNLALDVYYTSAGHGIPVMVNGEPMAGGTSPVTLAGALTVGNAEVLGGIVINQIIEPGRPCIHNLGFSHAMDMRKGTAITGGAENCLLAAAGAEIARINNLPSASWISADSMIADSQSAAEKTLAALTHYQNGVGVIWGAGTLEGELALSFAQAVIDHEIIGQIKRYVAGIEVNNETIAEELIERVGPCGNFLGEEHTMEHFRAEISEPDIYCRVQRENWESEGLLPLQEVAERRADELIANVSVPKLSENQVAELRKIEKSTMDSLS